MKKSGLGRGLNALFEENALSGQTVTTLRISEISPSKNQPRKEFEAEALEELADSIRLHGVLQPILVVQEESGYRIVAGERRWRASRMAGLSEVPVIIKELDERSIMEISLIENLQRENLNPIEEAEGYRSLIDVFELSQEEVAQRVGKSRPGISNSLRLLQLPEALITGLSHGKLSPGHAKVLLGLSDPELVTTLGSAAMAGGMSVRELERAVKRVQSKPPLPKPTAVSDRSHFIDEVELALKNELGRKVKITADDKKAGHGRLEIEFYSEEDLAEISRRLAGKNHY